MNQCKALNFQIIEEEPINAKLDFQGEIINTGAVSEEAIEAVVDKYFEKNPVVVEEVDPTIYEWAKQPEKPKYTADEIEGAVDGKSAYEIAVDKGFQGTEEEWLESLKGAAGEQGPIGNPGEVGPQGPKGEPGENYILTEEDKEEIANKVIIPAPEVNIPEWAQQETKPQYTAEETGAVPVERKIADIDLANDITTEEMQDKLSIYPVLFTTTRPNPNGFTDGKEGQLLICRFGDYDAEIYSCEIWDSSSNLYKWKLIAGSSLYSEKTLTSGNYLQGEDNAPPGYSYYLERPKQLFTHLGNGNWLNIKTANDIVTTINENSTDAQIPSAKAVYDLFLTYDNSLLEILGGDDNVE